MPPSAPSRRTPWKWIGLALAVLAVLAAGYWWYSKEPLPLFLSSPTARMAVSFGRSPAGALNAKDEASGGFKPAALRSGDVSLPVIDQIRGKDGRSYYLVYDDTSASTASLYARDGREAPVRLTWSANVKYGLSHDPASGLFAYHLLTPEGAQVVVFDPAAGTERNLGPGDRSRFVVGAPELLVQRGTAIVRVHRETGSESPFLETAASDLMALGSDSLPIAIFNPLTNQVDFFTVAPGNGAPTYTQSSSALTHAPSVLGYVGDELYAGRTEVTRQDVRHVFTAVADGREVVAKMIGGTRISRLTSLYE